MKELYEIYKTMDKLCGTNLLTESQESKSIDQAKTLYMQRIGCTREEADDFVRNKLRADIPALRGNKGGKFILGATRMFLDNQLYDAPTIGAFNSTIQYVVDKGYSDKFKKDLNGLSAQEFVAQFQQERQADFDNESEKLNNIYGSNTDTSKSRYQVVPINDFEDAKMYADYCDWCITGDPDMFDHYGCDGVNQIYFCLKNGFQDVPPERGVNCPLDEYGLSMISVIVNENGQLAWCTCRWNHNNGGNDHIMTMSQISELVGCNFRNVFPPNNKFANAVQEAQQQLANGEDPEDVFDDTEGFKFGWTKVELNTKYNLINTEGRFISDTWFEDVNHFCEDWALVKLNDKCNFINAEGHFISDTWFDNAFDFSGSWFRGLFAHVKLNGKSNFINTKGRFISDTWFDNAFDFTNGYARVKLNGKYNYINTKGQLISDTWFDLVNNFNEDCAPVMLNGKCNFINEEGQLISDTWFDEVKNFDFFKARVKLNDKWNYINKEGQLLSDTWFEEVDNFESYHARVKLNGKWNLIDNKGRIISDTWFDDVHDFGYNGYAEVKLNGKWYYIDTEGNLYDGETGEPIR